LRSARDEALLEETLRFNRVAARTDFTLAQALSLGLLEVPMVVVFALVYARAASPFALGSGSEQHSAPEHREGAGICGTRSIWWWAAPRSH